MTPQTHGWTLMRDAALSLALTHPFAGELANPRQMTAYTYRDSPAVGPDDPRFDTGPGAGAHLVDVALDAGFLSDRLGPGFTVLCADAALADAVLRCRHWHDTLHCVVVDDAAVRARYGLTGHAAYLIRPDLHVAARWREATPARIAACFDTLIDRPEAPV